MQKQIQLSRESTARPRGRAIKLMLGIKERRDEKGKIIPTPETELTCEEPDE